MSNQTATGNYTPEEEQSIKDWINSMLDIVEAGMERWQCGPEEALAKVTALQAARVAALRAAR